MKSLLSWMMALTLAIPALATAGPRTLPRPVAADPALTARLDPAAVAKLAGGFHPEQQLYLESREVRKSGGPAKIAGTGKCLVVLVKWADHPADVVAHPQADYQSMMFSVGVWPTGSMNDFYLENSYGQYQVQGLISGWHTATVPYANIDPTDYGRIRSMIAAVMLQLDPVIDYSQFDNDGPDGVPDSGDDDGIVDSFFFVHAGPGREQTGDDNDIWSHAWAFSPPLATNDGVKLKRYSVEPEMLMDGTLITVGVFCHEYGHVLGLPDLYDVDYTSSGIGDWGLMSGGSWGRTAGEPAGSSPSHFCAWCKKELGWIVPTAITSDALGVSIPPVETSPTAYRIFRDGASTGDEYFLVENRQAMGFDGSLTRRQVDLGLPQAAGLAIYHVDESVSSNSDERHRLVDVVEASPWFRSPTDWIENLDGPRDYALQFWLNEYNRGDNGDLWPGWTAVSADSSDWIGPRDRDRFADDTIPPAEDNECDPTGVAVENITPSGDDVIADFVFGAKRAPDGGAGQVAVLGLRDRHCGLVVLPQLRAPRHAPRRFLLRQERPVVRRRRSLLRVQSGLRQPVARLRADDRGRHHGRHGYPAPPLRHRERLRPRIRGGALRGRSRFALADGRRADRFEHLRHRHLGDPVLGDQRVRQHAGRRAAGPASAPGDRRRLVEPRTATSAASAGGSTRCRSTASTPSTPATRPTPACRRASRRRRTRSTRRRS